MKDRILAIIQEEEMTNARFAQEIGVQSSSISHITSGRNKPSIDLITKILNRFPGISAEWLLQGKGKMYKFQNEEQNVNPAVVPRTQPDLFSATQSPVVNTNRANEPVAEPEMPSGNISDESVPYGIKPGKRVEKVIVLYSDKSFSEYKPEI